MQIGFRIASALTGIVIFFCLSLQSNAQSVFPQHGFQFNCYRQENHPGWKCRGGGFYDGSNGGSLCCVYFLDSLQKKRETMLVQVSGTSGDEFQPIKNWIVVSWGRNDYIDDTESCEMNGQKFIFSVVNDKAKTITGIKIDENGFHQFSYTYAAFPCSDPD